VNETGASRNRSDRLRVLIAGAGVAGLEAMLALRSLAGDRVEIELMSPAEEFVYRPMLVAEPFGSGEVLRLSLRRLAREAGVSLRGDALVAVDPGNRAVITEGGERLAYDALIVALGARPVEAVPGALTFSGRAERRSFAQVLARLGHRGWERIAFVVPHEATWSIAAYELALLTAAECRARSIPSVQITLVTHEPAPLDLLGAPASQLVSARLAEAGIALRVSAVAETYEGGELRTEGGSSLAVDSVVALPALEGPAVPGLPQRGRGFILTDVGMQVPGPDAVWAAGDATSFPIKQGGLAAQQADVAARAVAARAGAHVPVEPFQPVLRGELITGGAPAFMRTRRAHPDDDAAADTPLWWPPTKVAGRYLGAYLGRTVGEGASPELLDLEPSGSSAEGATEHEQASALLLAAADADADAGDFEGALRWLSLVEHLNLVVPPDYVARRFEWRRQLAPELPVDEAVARLDPSFASAEAAISDLERRLGWLREIGERTGRQMKDELEDLDQGIDRLRTMSRQAGITGPGKGTARG
jgi:sulfide:quinone oxidoreductase